MRKAHFDPLSTLLAVAGVPIFIYLLRRSAQFHQQGGVTWKGRTYPGSEARINAAESNSQSPDAEEHVAHQGH